MDPARKRHGLVERLFRPAILRYVGTLGTVVAAVLIIRQLPLVSPIGGILTISIVLLCAWFGGLGPAVLIPVLLYVLSRIAGDKPAKSWFLTAEEWIGFGLISTVITAIGLAGRYRRRIRAVTQRHARKLSDQARALSLAHIVFRDYVGLVTEWGEGAERMFGWTNTEAVGRNLHELLATQFPCPLDEIQRNLLLSGQWEGEVVHRRKDGVELKIATHWILYRDGGRKPIGIAEVHNDVSELRRAEEAVREADRRKDVFLATLAHELRNPLAPIRTGLEILKIAKDDPALLEETRGTMERQTEQLIALVNDLLDVSRITRGKLEMRRKRVELGDVVQSAVEASRPCIEAAGHRLAVSTPDEPIALHADQHRLAQVFSNLLNNAARYTPPGGRLELSTERQGSDVVVAIRDNGIGIAADKLENIFEMFSQVEVMERCDSGLGIGLTLAKSLVEMHGGRIEARSDGPDRGSEFLVRLPVLVNPPVDIPTPPPVVAPAVECAGRRVLVVDDNFAAARLLSMVIQAHGNDVRTAGDGEEAIAVAAVFLPDLVLMDLGMPKMNGFEAARHMRQQPWGRDMLLVALSGWGQDEDKRKTQAAGFDHHLTKPAEPAELQRLIATAESKPAANGR